MYGPTGGGKKFATKFDFPFPAEYYTRLVAPLTPDFNVGISKLEMLRFSPGGTFDRKKVRNQKTRCVSPTLKSGGPGVSLVAEAYVSIVSMV